MFKGFLSVLKVKFIGVIRTVERRSFFAKKAKKWNVYAAITIFFVLFPVFVEAGEFLPCQIVVPEFNHGFFVSPKVHVENFSVAKGLGLQGVNSVVKGRSENVGGNTKSITSVIDDRDANCHDYSKNGNTSSNDLGVGHCDWSVVFLWFSIGCAIGSSYARSMWLIYGKR